MNSLIEVQNKDGQLVVTSRQVSKDFNKRHGDVLEKVNGLIKEMNSTEKSVQYFIQDSYKDSSGKSNKEYLLTRDGFSLLVMGFTGAKALQWKLKYIEAFNQMEKNSNLSVPLSPMDQLKLQYQVLEQHDNKLSSIENKVNLLEDKMTIDYAQQEELSSLAKRVVVQALGGKNAPAYKILSKKAFSTLWTDFKRIMQVNSYKNTAVKQFYRAKEIINNWKPSNDLRLMIMGANSQQIIY